MSLSASDASSALKTQLEFLLEKKTVLFFKTEDFASWQTTCILNTPARSELNETSYSTSKLSNNSTQQICPFRPDLGVLATQFAL